ncbi:MAG: efflux RND transporter permease subunit, partial [Gemmatimonadales bacterium]
MSLSSTSIRRPVAVAMFFLAVGVLGVISFERLPIDLLPDVSYPKLVIYTTYSGVAPAEVERFVTEPIEQVVAAVPGVESIESVSREGVSLVTLRFGWGSDMDFAALNVRERLDNIRDALPEESERPAVLRTDPTSEPIMAVSVAGSGDLFSLKELAEEVFKRRFEQIDGVAQAAVTGGLEREIHVEVNPRLLDSYGLSIQQVSEVLDAANQSAPGGTIRRGRFRYSLRTIGEFQDLDEIRNVPLTRSVSDTTAISGIVRLRDVALVTEGFKDRETIARYNNTNSVGLLLFKESGANTVRVADLVDEVIVQLGAENPEIDIRVAMNQAGFISDAIASVVQALLYGGALAFLVLFLFLRNARYPVAIALAIPISVIASFSLLDLAGVSLNIMSLGGLALGVGMLVDNSIVVLENIFRHTQEGKPIREAARLGAEEVQGAITASTLTTISVFGPIVYVEGVAGQLFGALSFAVAFALITSLVVALTLLPTMAARWGGSSDSHRGFISRLVATVGQLLGSAGTIVFGRLVSGFDRRFDRFANWYHTVLEAALDHRGRVAGVAATVLFLGVALGLVLDRGVLPEVDQGAFQVRLDLPRGTPIAETSEVAHRVEEALLDDPGVDVVFSRVGRRVAIAGVEEEESGLNTATIDVRVVRGVATVSVVRRLTPTFATLPAGVLTVETGQATALGRLLGGSDADLAV